MFRFELDRTMFITHSALKKWASSPSLPLRLVENIRKYDKSDDGESIAFHTGVHDIDLDWDKQIDWFYKNPHLIKRRLSGPPFKPKNDLPKR